MLFPGYKNVSIDTSKILFIMSKSYLIITSLCLLHFRLVDQKNILQINLEKVLFENSALDLQKKQL